MNVISLNIGQPVPDSAQDEDLSLPQLPLSNFIGLTVAELARSRTFLDEKMVQRFLSGRLAIRRFIKCHNAKIPVRENLHGGRGMWDLVSDIMAHVFPLCLSHLQIDNLSVMIRAFVAAILAEEGEVLIDIEMGDRPTLLKLHYLEGLLTIDMADVTGSFVIKMKLSENGLTTLVS